KPSNRDARRNSRGAPALPILRTPLLSNRIAGPDRQHAHSLLSLHLAGIYPAGGARHRVLRRRLPADGTVLLATPRRLCHRRALGACWPGHQLAHRARPWPRACRPETELCRRRQSPEPFRYLGTVRLAEYGPALGLQEGSALYPDHRYLLYGAWSCVCRPLQPQQGDGIAAAGP